MKFIDNTKEFIKKAIPLIIFLSLLSILFFPQDQTKYLAIPISISIVLGIIYFFLRE